MITARIHPFNKRNIVKKLAVLTNELPPYRRPIFERLGRHEGLEVTVYLSTRVEPHRMWDPAVDLPHVEVKPVVNLSVSIEEQERERLIHFPVGIFPVLMSKRPDVVISGEFGFRTLMAWFYCTLFRKPLVIWSGETDHSAASINSLQRISRGFLSSRAAGYLSYGQAARRYLHHLNIADDKITTLAQAVDNDYWMQAIQTADPGRVHRAHKTAGKVVLWVGHLQPRKGIHHLIEAWALMPKALQRENTLLLVGDGSEKARLEALVESLSAQNVVFAGPVPHGELPAYYAAADFFVFPTLLDVWGLVVNEAMASGLPVLCSKYAGCAEELIIPGQTGEVFDPTDTTTFSKLLAQWLQTAHTTPDPAIQAHIQRWNFESSVNGILEQLVKVGILSPSEAAAGDSPQPKRSGSS